MGFKSIIFGLLIIVISFSAQATEVIKPYKDNENFFKLKASHRDIKIMSLNAHNLYDTEHDEGFFDYTYLPIDHPAKETQCETIKGYYKKLCLNLDWTKDRLFKKIGQLSKIIKGYGSLPDVLALQEIENSVVISTLAKNTGYKKFIVTDLDNRRGVDLALLYQTRSLKYVNHTEIESPGRSVLRAHFTTKPSGKDLFIYVNHWVAQSAPTFLRVKTAEAIQEDINKLESEYHDPSIVMVGDFNTKFDEEEEVFNKSILNKDWSGHLVEAHESSRKKYPEYGKYFPEGSYWRGKNKWERFDRIFLSNNLLKSTSKLRADIKSYRLIYSTKLTGEYKYKVDKEDENSDEISVRYPLKYNFLEDPKYPLGFTDHLPSTIILKN